MTGLIKQIPLFRSLRKEDNDRIVALLKRLQLKKGDVLFREGDDGTALYIILTGKIKIVRQSKLGDEVILAVLTAGDLVGEMALLDGLQRSADAIVLEDAQLYVLNRKDFLSFVMQNESAVKAILASLTKRLRKADDFLEDIFFLSLPSRLTKKLVELAEIDGQSRKKSGEIELCLTQKELASMVGACRESINKELRILREKGMVQLTGNSIIIPDLELIKSRIR
jgi:CRP/FNR family cyclic AMP-dependent transcriptional regulator